MKIIDTLNQKLAPAHGFIKKATYWSNLVGLFVLGMLSGVKLTKWKDEQRRQQQPAVVSTGASKGEVVYQDDGKNLYVPLTMEECSYLCGSDREGALHLEIKGAGNALDNTAAWPKEAQYVGCFSGGECWVYEKNDPAPNEIIRWRKVKKPLPPETKVHLLFYPKQP